MPRPRSNDLKVGDKVKQKEREGVIVFVEPQKPSLFSVHFYPTGRGLFRQEELEKVRPTFKLAELVDEEIIESEEVNA